MKKLKLYKNVVMISEQNKNNKPIIIDRSNVNPSDRKIIIKEL